MNAFCYKTSEFLGAALDAKELKIVTAESCTGGGIGSAITSVPGSSRWFEYGFVTYSDVAKTSLLGVNQKTLTNYGAVSEEVVGEMLTGALKVSAAEVGIAVSGVSGPAGGAAHKPVGTVCVAWGSVGNIHTNTYLFSGERDQIREAAIKQCLHLALSFVRQYS